MIADLCLNYFSCFWKELNNNLCYKAEILVYAK